MQSNPSSDQIVFQVLGPADIDEVRELAQRNLIDRIPDETERTFFSWNAKWRTEALDHYLKLGWSFIARRNGKAVGFFLGQPLLFFGGRTQTLWIEYIEASSKDVREALADAAVRLSRENQLQRVLFADADQLTEELSRLNPIVFSEPVAEVKTRKG